MAYSSQRFLVSSAMAASAMDRVALITGVLYNDQGLLILWLPQAAVFRLAGGRELRDRQLHVAVAAATLDALFIEDDDATACGEDGEAQ